MMLLQPPSHSAVQPCELIVHVVRVCVVLLRERCADKREIVCLRA